MKSKFDIVYESLKAEAQKEVVVEGFWRAAKQMLTPRLNKKSANLANRTELLQDFGKACAAIGAHKQSGKIYTYDFSTDTETGDTVNAVISMTNPEKAQAKGWPIKLKVKLEGEDKPTEDGTTKISTSTTESEMVEMLNKILMSKIPGYHPKKDSDTQKKEKEAADKEAAAQADQAEQDAEE